MTDYKTYTYCKALRDDQVLVTVHQSEPKTSFFDRLRHRISRRKLLSSPSPSPPTTEYRPKVDAAPKDATAFVYNSDASTPLLTLPNELLLLTASFLSDPRDLGALLRTNKRFAWLLSPLCLQNFDCSVTALCWAVVTSNERMVRLLLEKGPGFMLFERDGSVGYPSVRDEGVVRPRIGWMFVVGPRLTFCVPGRLEEIAVREWAERGRWKRLLSYCWSTDEKRGLMWAQMVWKGL